MGNLTLYRDRQTVQYQDTVLKEAKGKEDKEEVDCKGKYLIKD